MLPALILASLGMGAIFMPLTLVATTGLADADQGLASGLFNTSQQIGGALGLAILSTLAASATSRAGAVSDKAALVTGFHWAFAGSSAVRARRSGAHGRAAPSAARRPHRDGGRSRARDRAVTQLRADAQRNLALVLEAAAAAFAEHGPDVSVDEIARRAGVGHATVFRRFPTKDALLFAVLRARLEEVTELARAALEAPDPDVAFTEFIWALMAIHARDRGLHQCFDRCLKEREAQEVEELMQRIVRRAQEAGAVRSDVSPADVPNLIGAAIRSAPAEQWRLYVEIVLAGLRPPAR